MTGEASSGLAVAGLTVRFGGLVAVNDVSLHAPRGRITGLIGPNGAGKSTTFNACSGLVRPSSGTVSLDDHDVTRVTPAGRARRGLGRTFQKMELFESLTVAENVALGREGALAGANPLKQMFATRSERHDAEERAVASIALCGLSDLASRRPSELSTGQRRLVELARVCAGEFSLLLLDEPSSGLDKSETARFGEILVELVAQRGLGILVVEHDMSLVLRICSYIYVLDFGKQIFDGTAAELASSEVVRAAYLGSEDVEGALA
ncbi:MAG: putative Sulfate-transporting ATPase [Frankiales bacterium]|nr:putative Sulfate-transporting ATPase [Frankiales bacterium]